MKDRCKDCRVGTLASSDLMVAKSEALKVKDDVIFYFNFCPKCGIKIEHPVPDNPFPQEV